MNRLTSTSARTPLAPAVGLNVPPGFTISAEACGEFEGSSPVDLPSEIAAQVTTGIAHIERVTGQSFTSGSDTAAPLLVSVRSGAAISMPGMVRVCCDLRVG